MPARVQNPAEFHQDMRVGEIVALFPQASEIFAEYGMHCSSCSLGARETLAEGAQVHGFSDDILTELLDDVNTAAKDSAKQDHVLTITPAAAAQVQAIAQAEGIEKAVLHVVIDGSGGFCLEFAEEEVPGGKSFACPDVPGVSVSASILVLNRVGGAVIDYRDDRFKLDLPDEQSGGCCKGNESECGCGE